MTRSFAKTVLHAVAAAVALSIAVHTAPALSDLRSVDELKSLFDHDRGRPRLVLLLSPT